MSAKILGKAAVLCTALWLAACASPTAQVTPSYPPELPVSPGQAAPPPFINSDSLAWDPSGRWLAYTDHSGGAWLQSREGDPMRVFGVAAGADASLRTAWSPDGGLLMIYGTWGVGAPPWSAIWLTRVGAQGPEPGSIVLTPVRAAARAQQAPNDLSAAGWSPAGDRIAYALAGEVWLYDLNNHRARQITRLAEKPLPRSKGSETFDGVRELAWSPQGDALALGLTCDCPSPWSGVAVLNLADEDVRLLIDGGQDVGWTPEGERITFRNASGDWSGGMTFDYYSIDLRSLDIENLTQSNPDWDPLLDSTGYKDAPYQTDDLAWSMNGDAYVYKTRDNRNSPAQPRIGFILRKTQQPAPQEYLGTNERLFLFPAFLADGSLAFLEASALRPDPEDPEIFTALSAKILPAHGQAVAENTIFQDIGLVAGAAWSPDGSALAVLRPAQTASLPDRVKIFILK